MDVSVGGLMCGCVVEWFGMWMVVLLYVWMCGLMCR